MTVTWGKKAYDDLDQIVDYLADLNPKAAKDIISRIQQAVLTLGDFPNLGRRWTRPASVD